MLFTGEYERTIDAKDRMAIPSEVRSQVSGDGQTAAFYIVPGANDALWLWPASTFEQMAGAMTQSLLPPEELMEFEELIFPNARRLELDGNGRVRLPRAMLDRTGIGTDVVILGVRDRLELRDPAKWRARQEETLAKPGEIMLRARRVLAEQQHAARDRTDSS